MAEYDLIEVYDNHLAEDLAWCWEHYELAILALTGEFDERDPEHLDLAREYLDDQGVLARKEAL